MKKLMTLMLGMALAFGAVSVSFAQDSGTTKTEGKKKKKGGKKKGSEGTTETPKGSR